VIAALGGAGITMYRYKKMHEEEIAKEKLFEEEQKRRIIADKLERQNLLDLQQRYNDFMEHKIAGPYETADVVSRCLDDNSKILSMTIKDGFFQMELKATDSLDVLKSFENSRKIRNPALQQIHPVGKWEHFTISGTVLPEKAVIDSALPISEQVSRLEELIKKEEDSINGRERQRPSAFGVDIRGLLKKWGCTVSSYQYFTLESGREIEFSIKTTSDKFFSFLKDASESNEGWIFTLVQIRNLAPQNALDVVFRAKAETVSEDQVEDTGQYAKAPVSQISRNYYIPSKQPIVAKEEPEPIPLPLPPPPPPEPPQKPEQASWLEYIGATEGNAGGQYIYIKNSRSGALIRLEGKNEGDFRYVISPAGSIVAFMDGKLYEIRRK
jgi:hypothetical protein